MKRKLFVVATILIAACNDQSKNEQAKFLSEEDRAASQIIEHELEVCDETIAKYQSQIDQTLAGDVEAMKKLPLTKARIEKELAELKKLATLFDAKQADRFSATQERFLVVDSRIK